ncbi:MAG: iron-sulfur cluster-binding domain-containing protein [Chloroflexia bacterium]
MSTAGPHVRVHHSAVHGRIDLWPYLAEPRDGRHVYCCAARPLMEEVRGLTMHWRPSSVHFEDFAGVAASQVSDQPFQAVWAPNGRTVEVDPDSTLLDALNRAGAEVASSCRSGTCSTCVLRLFKGQAEHRDPCSMRRALESGHRLRVKGSGQTLTVGPLER